MNRLRSALNGTELKILAVLFRREAALEMPPSLKELADLIGVRDGGWLWDVMFEMRRKGLLTWEDTKTRTIRLTCRIVAETPAQQTPPGVA